MRPPTIVSSTARSRSRSSAQKEVAAMKSENIPAIVVIAALRKNPASPYPVMEPDTLKSIAFIEKDSKRFPETSG
jgi:hypothetical protein